jgi:hypothetical protein
MAEQEPTPSQSKPFMKFGRNVVKLQDMSSKTRNDKQTPEPGLKVRQLRSKRPYNQNLELNSDDPNTNGSSLQSTKLQDTSSKKRSNEYKLEPGIKVRRLQSERHDNLMMVMVGVHRLHNRFPSWVCQLKTCQHILWHHLTRCM